MKAEHRKELETNVLADKMGRFMQNVRHKPSRRSVTTWVLLVVVAVLGVAFWMVWTGRQRNTSELWLQLNGGGAKEVQALAQSGGEPGQAASAQLAWFLLWDSGVKFLPASPKQAIPSIKQAKARYDKLFEQAAEDPVLGPESLYGIAVAYEALAVEDPEKNLRAAKEAYQKLVAQDEYKKSVFYELAQERLKSFNDQEEFAKMVAFYTQMRDETPLDRMTEEMIKGHLKARGLGS